MGEEITSSRMIKDMSVDERPREKAINHGVDVLSDAELMAIIFATGIRGKSVITMCQEIIDGEGGIDQVTKLSPHMLVKRYKGIGMVKAVTLLAALKLGERARDAEMRRDPPLINTSEIAHKVMRNHFVRLQHEEFWVLLIDRAGHKIREVRISQGGTAATTVDVKLILKSAIESLASCMILFHNHPSGTLRPSVEDDHLTRKIVEAAKMVDVRVNDHIIVTDGGYYSYADQGRM